MGHLDTYKVAKGSPWTLFAITHPCVVCRPRGGGHGRDERWQTYPLIRPTVSLVTPIQRWGFQTDRALTGFHSAMIHIKLTFPRGKSHNGQPHVPQGILFTGELRGKKESTEASWFAWRRYNYVLSFTRLSHDALWHVRPLLFPWPDMGRIDRFRECFLT